MKHSIVIPTFNNSKLVIQCIDSLRKWEKSLDIQIIVVDDGSTDVKNAITYGHAKEMGFDLCLLSKNGGFAAAVNSGIHYATGDVVTLVNNDIIFTHPIFDAIERGFKRDPEIGIQGALLRYPNGLIQHSGLYFNKKAQSFFDHFKNTRMILSASSYVLAVTGALFSIKKEVIAKIGGLNTNYFIACEDTEYCLRAWENGFRVYYNSEINAVHVEGATRGNSPQTKKQKSPEWHVKEFEAIKRFRKDIVKYDIPSLEKKVRKLNGLESKLEVGSGHNPQPGYVHLDVRDGLPELHAVCDFSKDPLPFDDKTFTEVLANHVIEHIPWRKLPFVLGEWLRVLEPGGKLVLRTPDLRFICESYLAGITTKEYPPDEDHIKKHLSGGESTHTLSPAWWANLKLFSGQDYGANFHHCCFDFTMLGSLLKRVGFSKVIKIKLDKEFSPGELQVEARKNGATLELVGEENAHPAPIIGELKADYRYGTVKYVANKADKKTVLVKRKGALGDVLLTTPIVERLYAEGWRVDVATDSKEVFENNPYVNIAGPYYIFNPYHDKVIDLDLAYERAPYMHVIDAYSMVAFGDTHTPHRLSTYFGLGLDDTRQRGNRVVIHAGKSWENRTWPAKKWDEVAFEIAKLAYFVDTIGPDKELSLAKVAKRIYQARLFIGNDSGLLHLAQALGVPSIGLYTCARAEYRATLKYHHFPIIPDIDCYGCLHDEPPPVTYCGCRRGDLKCLDLITPEMVMAKVKEVLNGTR